MRNHEDIFYKDKKSTSLFDMINKIYMISA